MKKGIVCVILVILFAVTAVGCSGQEPASDYFLFGVTSLKFEGGNTAKAEQESIAFLKEFENKIAVNRADSDIDRINRAGAGESVTVCDWTRDNLLVAREVYDATGGAFNPALYPLTELWGFAPDNEQGYSTPRPEPEAALIAECGKHTDFSGVTVSGNTVTKSDGALRLDLGGVAKGFAADEIVRIAKRNGVLRGSVDIGGNLYVIGEKSDGAAYNIGIRDPRAEEWKELNTYYAAVKVRNCSVTTSGDYERYYKYNGVRYCHIMDGNTGKPVQSGVMSVTVLDVSSAKADAYATAAFVLGQQAAVQCFETMKLNAVLAFSEGEAYYYRTVGQVELMPDYQYKEYLPWSGDETN